MDKFIEILKNIKLPIIAIVILVIVLIFSRECDRDTVCPPKGYILVTQEFVDSLINVANIPPDTVFDTTIIKGDIVYVDKEVPVPVTIDPQTNFYIDSIVNNKISVWMYVTVEGYITEWDWEYEPKVIEREKIITKYIPKVVTHEKLVRKSGMYASLGVGGNQSAFMLSGGIDYINRKDKLYGIQYMRFGQQDYYLFKLGVKIKF